METRGSGTERASLNQALSEAMEKFGEENGSRGKMIFSHSLVPAARMDPTSGTISDKLTNINAIKHTTIQT